MPKDECQLKMDGLLSVETNFLEQTCRVSMLHSSAGVTLDRKWGRARIAPAVQGSTHGSFWVSLQR
jgi:hypothetical protein